jgi:hypothetical protein
LEVPEMKRTRPLLVILLAISLFYPSILPTSLGQERAEGTLRDLGFMSGCWEGIFRAERGSGVIEEFFTSPSDNLMLGTTRYILEGRTVMWEFSKIEESDGGVLLTPFPRGRPSEHGFRMTSLDDGEVLFEAPEHDFPKRIGYRREGDRLIAHVDDGSNELVDEWEMTPAPCD